MYNETNNTSAIESFKRKEFFTPEKMQEIVDAHEVVRDGATDLQALANKLIDVANRALSNIEALSNSTDRGNRVRVANRLSEAKAIGKIFTENNSVLKKLIDVYQANFKKDNDKELS